MKNSITILFTLACVCAQAQDDKANLIMITGGLASPTGDFASTDYSSSAAGFAKNGFVGDVVFQHKLKKFQKFGYTAMFRYQTFGFNTDAFSSGFGAGSTTANNWTSSSVLVGPVWTFALSNKFFFEPRVMIGMAFANSPHVIAYGEGTYEVPAASGNAFSFLGGFNVRYDVLKRISLFIRADYQSAKPTFNSQSFAMSALNTAFGVGYRF